MGQFEVNLGYDDLRSVETRYILIELLEVLLCIRFGKYQKKRNSDFEDIEKALRE